MPSSTFRVLASLLGCLTAAALQGAPRPAPVIPRIELATPAPPPEWALVQRHLLDQLAPAALEFVRRYTRPDGTIIWRDVWPGMDGSDDGYESFYNFPLYYALGGASEIEPLARKLWEGVTRQFTKYGQVDREFDAGYDWMHHGESYVNFYFFGLAHPGDRRMRERALRFAGLYLNEDRRAPNYDPALHLMRSPLTGSRGPRFVTTELDWSTHRDDLAPYPLPYEDIPGITSGRAWLDDTLYPRLLAVLNERMMRGDVPLNLTATSLILHAYLHSPQPKYRAWVLDYVAAWKKRAQDNGGVLPDNVGLSGKIGEYMGGKWWGGYYGWKWPHGLFNQIEGTLIGGANALLLSGDPAQLDLVRGVLETVRREGRLEKGVFVVPHRHDERGWHDFRPVQPSYLIHLWYLSQDPADYDRIGAMANTSAWTRLNYHKAKGDYGHEGPWLRFLEGKFPEYPVQMLQANYRESLRRLEMIRTDRTTVEQQDVHHWQQRNPVVLEGLVQTMLGGPNHIYHGGLLHTRLRYFDPVRRRPGVPPDVAALVDGISTNGVSVTLVNLHPTEPREVILSAGAFGEHEFTGVQSKAGGKPAAFTPGPWLRVLLKPAATGRLELGLRRYARTPSYAQPF